MGAEPTIVSTWDFGRGCNEAALAALCAGAEPLDALEAGIRAVEDDPAVASVGWNGRPNADGVVEQDAVIMDGPRHRSGAVAALAGIQGAISVARRVMERTPHAMLAGQGARAFALAEGFPDLAGAPLPPEREAEWRAWREAGARFSLGHDTVGSVLRAADGRLYGGCSTSGLAFKRVGRVGDSPVVGSGLFVDRALGAAAATGVGEVILRDCLSLRAVEGLRAGLSAQAACEAAVRVLLSRDPGNARFSCAVLLVAADGSVGAASTLPFPYYVTAAGRTERREFPGLAGRRN